MPLPGVYANVEKAIAETIAVANGAASAASSQLAKINQLTTDMVGVQTAIAQKVDKSVTDSMRTLVEDARRREEVSCTRVADPMKRSCVLVHL